MKDKFFIDTNIFIYCFDEEEIEKGTIAEKLIGEALLTKTGVISFQVVQEFHNVMIRKQLISRDVLTGFAKETVWRLWKILPTREMHEQALMIHDSHQLSYYDSLIVASALQAKCKKLYTEDMHHGQKIDGLEIVNPFV